MCGFLKNSERLFCLPLDRLEENKWMSLCMARHPLKLYAYLQKTYSTLSQGMVLNLKIGLLKSKKHL